MGGGAGGMWHNNNQNNKDSLPQAFVHTVKVGRIIDCICEYPLSTRWHLILNGMMMVTILKQLLLLSSPLKVTQMGIKILLNFCYEIIKTYLMSDFCMCRLLRELH